MVLMMVLKMVVLLAVARADNSADPAPPAPSEAATASAPPVPGFPSLSRLFASDSFALATPQADLDPTSLAEAAPMSFSQSLFPASNLVETNLAKNSPMSFSLTSIPSSNLEETDFASNFPMDFTLPKIAQDLSVSFTDDYGSGSEPATPEAAGSNADQTVQLDAEGKLPLEPTVHRTARFKRRASSFQPSFSFPAKAHTSFHHATAPSHHKISFPSSHKSSFPSSHISSSHSSHKTSFPSSHKTFFPSSHKTSFPSSHKTSFPSAQKTSFPSFFSSLDSSAPFHISFPRPDFDQGHSSFDVNTNFLLPATSLEAVNRPVRQNHRPPPRYPPLDPFHNTEFIPLPGPSSPNYALPLTPGNPHMIRGLGHRNVHFRRPIRQVDIAHFLSSHRPDSFGDFKYKSSRGFERSGYRQILKNAQKSRVPK